MRLCTAGHGRRIRALPGLRYGPQYPCGSHSYPRPGGVALKAIHIALGVLAIGLTGVAALVGAWCWWRVRTTRWFWWVLRAAQAAVVVEAAWGGLLLLTGHKAPGLHELYGVLPLLVSVIAEQLRVASAQMVLDARGFSSSRDVAALPAEEQRVIVLSIVQREIAVMVLASIVNVVLLARAAGTA